MLETKAETRKDLPKVRQPKCQGQALDPRPRDSMAGGVSVVCGHPGVAQGTRVWTSPSEATDSHPSQGKLPQE